MGFFLLFVDLMMNFLCAKLCLEYTLSTLLKLKFRTY
jgi:hypothetical protein